MALLLPRKLEAGARVAIVSPASVVDPALIDGAAARLASRGYEPVVAPHAKGPAWRGYAAEAAARTADWLAALADPSVSAILCARGGYGCMEVAAATPMQLLRDNPKWVVGYSDVTALHGLMQSAGIASIHGPMARHLATEAPDDPCTERLFALLEGRPAGPVTAPAHALNHTGRAHGMLVGGNLALISALAQTPFDLMAPLARGRDVILVIEDINEAPYSIDRMLRRLHMAGLLGRARGLVMGSFTNCRPDADGQPVEARIARLLGEWGYAGPVAFGFPVGHTRLNYPFVEGAEARLSVGPEGAVLD